jgi:hypothetical protein
MNTIRSTQLKPVLSVLVFAGTVAAPVSAQTVLHYWDMESTADVVGGLSTSTIGSPDLSLHATYGAAYAGSNQSLNTVLGGLPSGGGFLSADVHDGVNATAMDFGTGDFSFSYWAYDDATDGDIRGARIFDNLDDMATGIQLGTNATNEFNLRIDDDMGGSTISNNTLAIQMPVNVWVHVAVNVDRGGGALEIYFNGVSQGTAPLTSGATAAVQPTQDFQIGVINGGTTPSTAQQSGLDDLAFYDSLLSQSDISGLASGTLTPLDFGAQSAGTAYCFGDSTGGFCPCAGFGAPGEGCLNTGGTGATMVGSGSTLMSLDTLQFQITGVPGAKPGLVLRGDNQVVAPAGDGILCTSGNSMRSHVQVTVAGQTTYTDFNGSGFGAISNLGTPTNFQFWYRDTTNPCSGAGFNFTNGVSVTYLP